ncbi:hypothetical protein NIES4073_59460 [Kalymmatonema gypsitolerans NIES-4073]|nr:hypothetical protein NIES4073_59460 [Scytonema sp. NIES-4073]
MLRTRYAFAKRLRRRYANAVPQEAVVRNLHAVVRSEQVVDRSQQAVVRSEQVVVRSQQAVVRDFQEINYPSCGVGILPALNTKDGWGHPSHKKIWDIFLFGSPL